MRFVPILLLCLIGTSAPAQSNPAGSLFLTTRFDATVVVRKHSMGADIVEITVLKPTYSADLLNRQVEQIAREVKEEPRGFSLFRYQYDPSDATATVLKAKFAVDGLIDRATGVLRLQPIVRGLCLATATDQLNGLMVQFEAEKPTSKTLRSCSPPAPGCSGVEVEGQAKGPVLGIEYRVKILSHDPKSIFLPDGGQPPEPVVSAPRPAAPKTDWTLYGLLGVAAAAVGALVYSLLLRSGSRGRPPAPPTGRPSTRP